MTEDPIRDGLNWYTYCGNNPVMFVDPWGLEYGWLKTFVDDLEFLDIYATYTYYSDSAIISFSTGGQTYSRRFYYNGFIYDYGPGPEGWTQTATKIADNINDRLYLEREDFYKAMGIDYYREERNYTVTQLEYDLQNIVTTGVITIGTGILTLGAGTTAATISSLVTGAGGYYLTSRLLENPGNYRHVTTIAVLPDFTNMITGETMYNALATNEWYWKVPGQDEYLKNPIKAVTLPHYRFWIDTVYP